MSKKFLLSTALVFALLAGKSIATENKPFESDEVTSTALVVSPFSQLPEETMTQVVFYVTEKNDLGIDNLTDNLTRFAVTSKDNYLLAKKIVEGFYPHLKLNPNVKLACFGSRNFTFYNAIASHWIELDLEEIFKSNEYKTADDSYRGLLILRDIKDISNTRNYRVSQEIEALRDDLREFSSGKSEPDYINYDFSRDFHILISYSKALHKDYSSKDTRTMISTYLENQKKLSHVDYLLGKHYLEKKIQFIGSQLSERLGVENLHSEIMAHPEVQNYLLEIEKAKKERQDREAQLPNITLRLSEIKAMTNSQEEFLAHPEVQAELQASLRDAANECAIM